MKQYGYSTLQADYAYALAESARKAQAIADDSRARIPEGAMRVAPGCDALVWRINPRDCGEL